MSDETCTDFTLTFYFPLVNISIPEIVYIQFHLWKQKFSIQKRGRKTETLTQIYSVTQTLTNSTHRLLKPFH